MTQQYPSLGIYPGEIPTEACVTHPAYYTCLYEIKGGLGNHRHVKFIKHGQRMPPGDVQQSSRKFGNMTRS